MNLLFTLSSAVVFHHHKSLFTLIEPECFTTHKFINLSVFIKLGPRRIIFSINALVYNRSINHITTLLSMSILLSNEFAHLLRFYGVPLESTVLKIKGVCPIHSIIPQTWRFWCQKLGYRTLYMWYDMPKICMCSLGKVFWRNQWKTLLEIRKRGYHIL